METEKDNSWHLVRNNNGEWISDDYVVFISKVEACILSQYAAKQNKPLVIQHCQEGCLWCYKHELDAIDLSKGIGETGP
jgi:phosphoribosylformylglycinamidine (FGAM) synthase-like amidotransferase family enzyme